MEYGDEGWSGMDGKRRPFRDEYRDTFFGVFDGERLRDPFSVMFDPHQQLQVITGLIDKANLFHEGEDSALQLLQQMIANLGFGAAEMPSKEGSLPFNGMRIASLLNDFFAG